VPRGKKEEKGKKEETSTETIKVTPSVKRELTKTKALMEFYLEREVSFNEVIQALLDEAPKTMFGPIMRKVEEARNAEHS